MRRAVLLPLLGACLLVAVSAASLPWNDGLLHRPPTPFARSDARGMSPGFALLTAAAGAIPEGASVVALTEPPDATQETYLHGFGIALLPRREVLPAAMYGAFTDPAAWKNSRYVIVLGPRPAAAPGDLVLETPDGTVWRRAAP